MQLFQYRRPCKAGSCVAARKIRIFFTVLFRAQLFHKRMWNRMRFPDARQWQKNWQIRHDITGKSLPLIRAADIDYVIL